MVIKVKVFSGDDVKYGASLAIKHRLYVPGWELRGRLGLLCRRRVAGSVIGLCYVNNIPVAVVVKERTIQAFCRKAYRRLGYASRTLQRVLDCVGTGANIPIANEGINGSADFWQSHNITVSNYRGFE